MILFFVLRHHDLKPCVECYDEVRENDLDNKMEILMTSPLPLLVLIGSTAVGKTELSYRISETFGCEIIGMDSMQVHRLMDVGTAKPTKVERASIPHYIIDMVDPDDDYSAGRFARDASEAILMIHGRGKIPLLVGGSGLYMKALLEGFTTIPQDGALEKEAVRNQLKKKSNKELFEELFECDPQSAARIHPHDTQRLIRAIEIFRLSGIPWSQHLNRQDHSSQFTGILKIGLTRNREELYARIEKRVGQMLEQGLVQEVQKLLEMGYNPGLKSLQSIGYRHIVSYLTGEWTWEESIRFLVRDTRRYAKRQLTWFKRDSEILWFHPSDQEKIFSAINNFLTD